MKLKKWGSRLAVVLSAFMIMSVVLAPVGMVAYAESVVGEDIYDIDINTVIDDDVVVHADDIWPVAWGDDCVVVINGNLTLEDGDPDDDVDGGDLTVDSNGLVIVNGDLYVGVAGTLSNFDSSNAKVVVTGTVTAAPDAFISDGVLVHTNLQNIAYVDGTVGQDAYFTSGGKFYTFNGSEFVEIASPVTDTTTVQVADKDAFVGNDGLGNLRLVTEVTYDTANTVTAYGTWFIPQSLLNDTNYEHATVNYTGSITSGESFTADLIKIPAANISTSIAAVSYVVIEGQTVSSEVVTANVADLKNETSK